MLIMIHSAKPPQHAQEIARHHWWSSRGAGIGCYLKKLVGEFASLLIDMPMLIGASKPDHVCAKPTRFREHTQTQL